MAKVYSIEIIIPEDEKERPYISICKHANEISALLNTDKDCLLGTAPTLRKAKDLACFAIDYVKNKIEKMKEELNNEKSKITFV